MININTNVGSLYAANAASKAADTMNVAMQRLSTGIRINSAKDDAAGQAISTRLTAEVQGLAMASRNAADAQSMIDTAEGALQESHSILLRMRELSVQASNGTLNTADMAALDKEFQDLELEIDRIAHNTTWAGVNLLDGTHRDSLGTDGLKFQLGVNGSSSDRIEVFFSDMDAANGLSISGDLTSQSNAQTAIGVIDTAIATVSAERAKFGAVSNRLSSTMNNLDQISVNLSASNGRIQDTDFAEETGNLAKNQILQQAATAMVAQANASKGSVLTLLQN
jgi:flagellin